MAKVREDGKDPESPATTSFAYDSMKPVWDKVATVLAGTSAMRAAGQAYLPQHAEESNAAYRERRVKAILFNVSELTLDSWVGRPFSDPVQFSEETPDVIEDISKDIDQVGTDLHVFCARWYGDGVGKALSHVLVDFPRTDIEAPQTLADDQEMGARPYWVHILPENLIFADSEIVDGREILREVRIKEEIVERDGFAEVVIPQIRRIWLEIVPGAEPIGHVELYRLNPQNKQKEEWLLHETYPYSLGVIPLVTFYSDRDGFMHGKPPLEDLVDLNIHHWQSLSDQITVLTVARFPMLALSGGAPKTGTRLTVGPHSWFHSPDTGAKYYYIEHTGKAIAAGRQDLIDTEDRMESYGAEWLKKRPGNLTATARALDSAEATSPLQDITLRFIHAVNQALEYTAMWLKIDLPEKASIVITTDFGPEAATPEQMTTLRETRKMTDISRKAYLEELKRLGLLSDDYDIDKDAAQIEKEQMDTFGGEVTDEDEDEDEGEGETPEGDEEGENTVE